MRAILGLLGHAHLSQLLPKQCHCVSCDSLPMQFRPPHFHVLKVITSHQMSAKWLWHSRFLTAFEHYVICALCNSYSCKSPVPATLCHPICWEGSHTSRLGIAVGWGRNTLWKASVLADSIDFTAGCSDHGKWRNRNFVEVKINLKSSI